MKTDEWYTRRAKGIGGSEAAAVLGISPFKTALRLWKEKRKEIAPEDIESEEQVYWGTILENTIAQEYQRRTNRTVIRKSQISQHPVNFWMLANVDRFVRGIKDLILEIKNVGLWAFNKAEWGDDGSQKVPIAYYTQAQHNMAVTGAIQCDMPILVGGNHYACYHIPRDEKFIERLVWEEKRFWESLESGPMPEPINIEDLKILFPHTHVGINCEAQEDTAKAWAQLIAVNRDISRLKKIKQQHEFVIKKDFGEAETLSFDGIRLATYKENKVGKRMLRIITNGTGGEEEED